MFEMAMLQSVRTILTIALGIYLALDLWRLNRAGPAFAIRQMRISPEDPEHLLLLHGRQTGLLAWVYTHLGLEADATLRLTANDISIERQSLKGFERFYAPIHDLSCSLCGYYRAVSLVLIAVSLLIGGYLQLYTAWSIADPYDKQTALGFAGVSTISGSVGAVVAYWLFEISKRMTVAVETKGGAKFGVALKRNVIENVTIGLPESLQAVAVLNKTILSGTPSVKASLIAEHSPVN